MVWVRTRAEVFILTRPLRRCRQVHAAMVLWLMLLVDLVATAATASNLNCVPPFLADANTIRQHHFGEPRTCEIMQNVCFYDSSTLVLYDFEASQGMRKEPPVEWPRVEVTEHFKHGSLGDESKIYGTEYKPPRMLVRLATKQEWLAKQQYDARRKADPSKPPFFFRCTLPYVATGHYMSNVGEFMGRHLAWTDVLQHGLIEQSGTAIMDENATIVMATIGGIPLTPFQKFVLQAYSKYPPTTLSFFTSRHPPKQGSNFTAEGVWGRRCYERALFCHFKHGSYTTLVRTGQHVVQHYMSQLKPLMGKLWTSVGGARRTLRVLFEKRTGMASTRQILNLADILQQCNAFQGWANILHAPYKSVECKAYSFGSDFLEDLAVLRDTDVLIGIHGAGLMNSIYLPKHASMVELRPFEFGTNHTFLADIWWPQVCKYQGYFHFCWFLNIDENGSWESDTHATNVVNGNPVFIARDRSIRLRLGYLLHLLPRITAVSGQPRKYRSQFWGQQVAFTVVPNGTIQSAFTTKTMEEEQRTKGHIFVDEAGTKLIE